MNLSIAYEKIKEPQIAITYCKKSIKIISGNILLDQQKITLIKQRILMLAKQIIN